MNHIGIYKYDGWYVKFIIETSMGPNEIWFKYSIFLIHIEVLNHVFVH